MSENEIIRVGMIDFLNGVIPDYQLNLHGCEKNYGMPSALNIRLRRGDLDISPVSSMEYVLHHVNYRILPGLCIRADQRAATVGVFSSLPPDMWHKKRLYLSGASLTSVYLLKLLCKAFYKIKPEFIQQPIDKVVEESLTDVLKHSDAMLIIGDRAYEEQKTMDTGIQYYDLAEAWKTWTGLPFVFALWLVRNEIADQRPSCIIEIHEAFLRSINSGLKNLDDICNRLSDRWPRQQIIEYFKVNLAYDLNDQAVRGLTVFIEELYRNDLIPIKVPLRFFRP